MGQIDVKQELANQANEKEVRLTKNMSMADMVKALMPEISKALPAVITPDRFVRVALSALNKSPQLEQCTKISFIAALLSAAQLGLTINDELGQAYLVPCKNKGVMECLLIIGYKGYLDLAYRSGQIINIMASEVREKDFFDYEYGLNAKLIHKPASSNRGEITHFYGCFKTVVGGYGFYVMSKEDMEGFAKTYSKAYDSNFSPWKTNFVDMGCKTVLRKLFKYMPSTTEVQQAIASDETIKKQLSEEMVSVSNELEYQEVA